VRNRLRSHTRTRFQCIKHPVSHGRVRKRERL
jgi:hypothetical protein